eukprot:3866054-Lingulodinium_polyedra.AAC.1
MARALLSVRRRQLVQMARRQREPCVAKKFARARGVAFGSLWARAPPPGAPGARRGGASAFGCDRDVQSPRGRSN